MKPGDIIYLDKKHRRADKEHIVHVVREGENDGFIERLIVDADRQYQVGNLYLLDITPLSDVRLSLIHILLS